MKKHVALGGSGTSMQIILEESAIEQLEVDIAAEVLNPTGEFVSVNDYIEEDQKINKDIRIRLSGIFLIVISDMSNIVRPPQGFLPPRPAGNSA